jgi:hypothetical protein
MHRLCRVVTRKEADAICREAEKDFPPEWERACPAIPLKPKWDRESWTLSIGGIVCRKFTKRFGNQIKILEALQASGWPGESIANPLRDESQLHQAIKDFNRSVKKPTLFRLVSDHNRVRWE